MCGLNDLAESAAAKCADSAGGGKESSKDVDTISQFEEIVWLVCVSEAFGKRMDYYNQ